MPLEAPRLDDRTFEDIVKEARRRIPLYCPEWTDHNPSDPGMTLVELFAWMTDIVLYRLNRVPDKHYIKFMELIGIHLREPEPAQVPVTFWLTAPQPTPINIPALSEVATTRTETRPAIVFSTDRDFEIRVPKLRHVLTSRGSQKGGRSFQEQNVRQLEDGAAGYQGFAAFSGDGAPETKPVPDDAFYLGFEEDLSHHILGLELDVVRAKGEGVDPRRPPYIWEVTSDDTSGWTKADVDIDQTKGLNVSGLIRLHLPPMQKAARDRRDAYWLRCRLIPAPEGRSYRESPVIRQLRVGSWGCTVSATNVAAVHDEILGRSDGSPGQRFYLRQTPIVARRPDEHLVVRYDDGREEHWREVSDFASSSDDDLHYTLDSASGEIRLGPAMPQRDGGLRLYGAIPPKNTVLIMTKYRYGGGQVGNLSEKTLNVNKSGLPYVDRVLNLKPAFGGLDAEQLEDGKLRVPHYLRGLGRAVTADDFSALALEAAPNLVGRTYCVQSPAQAGFVRVLVIPRVPQQRGQIAPESLRLPGGLRDRILAYLDERRLLCTRLEVSAPEYRWVRTEVRLRASATAHKSAVAQAIEERLFAFLDPLVGGYDGRGWPFERDVVDAEVEAALYSVPGVDFIRSVKLFLISFDADGRAELPGQQVDVIPLASDQMIVSYQHDVIPD